MNISRSTLEFNYGIDPTEIDSNGKNYFLGLLNRLMQVTIAENVDGTGKASLKVQAWIQHPISLCYKRLFLNKRKNLAYQLPITFSLIGSMQRAIGIKVALYNPSTVEEDVKVFMFQDEEYNYAIAEEPMALDSSLQTEKNFFLHFGFMALLKYLKISESSKDSGKYMLSVPANKPFPWEDIPVPRVQSFELAAVQAMREMAGTGRPPQQN